MAFQIKDFASITASMVNVIRASTKKVTDFNVGSVIRTMLEAVGIETDQLYQEMFHGLKEAIPVATYTSFDFGLQPAQPATGALTYYASGTQTSSILIPTGTVAKNPTTGQLYSTIVDAQIAVGQTQVSVSAVANQNGVAGNCDAGAITERVDALSGVVGVSNLTPFTNGRDQESEEERKLRFIGYISTLNRGTLKAIRYGASTTVLLNSSGQVVERVVHIGIFEPYEDDPVSNPPGFVEVYVHNGTGGTSPALVTETQKVIDGYYLGDGTPVPGWKAAGVEVDCMAATEKLVAVTGVLTLNVGYQSATVLPQATTVVREYLLSLGIGSPAITAEIIERVMALEGVYDFVLSAPSTAQTTALHSEKIMPGVVTLTAA